MMELLLKASFALTVALLFYKLLLQQESFFTVNRFYLVGCLALAFALPFVSLPKLISHQGYLATVLQTKAHPEISEIKQEQKTPEAAPKNLPASKTKITAPSSKPQAAKSPIVVAESPRVVAEAPVPTRSWLFWVAAFYLFGVIVFTLSLLFQVATVIFKILTATDKIADGEVVIVNTANRQAPCSFFKYIFIYPNDYDFDTYEQIIAHEKIHARLGHSFDLLLAEIVVIILWFNPFSWLFKREIEKNNEYQTDALLLEKEQVSPQQYQLNLVQIAVPNKPLSITTNYNQSLLKQRILRMNAKKSTPHAYWKYSFLVPLFFGTLLMLNEPATSQELPVSTILMAIKTKPASEVVQEKITPKVAVKASVKTAVKVKTPKPVVKTRQSTNIRYGDVDMAAGFWYGHQAGNEYCLELKGSRDRSNWNMTQCFAKNSFQKKADNVFVMTKEAGTLELTGNLEAEVSQGKYTFTENAAFKKYLADYNLLNKDKNTLFHLFFAGVNRAYVDFLKKNYAEVNGERLLEAAIHDISLADHQSYMALFQKYNNRRPSLPEVVEAKIHDVDEAYAQELQKMGFQGLTMKKIIEAKIHDVNAPFLAGLKKAGYNNLLIDKVIEAKIHDVDADFLANLKQAGFSDLPLNKVIEARIHDINPATAKELRALGFGELGLDKMIELQIHDVNANYIKELQTAGLKNLTLDQVLEARIHDLDPASIKAIQGLGFTNVDFKELMNAQIHEVDAAFLTGLKEAGFKDLSLDKTVEAKIHDIDGNFIKQARQKGYNFNSIDKYISLKIHGMAIESLKEDKDK